MARMRCLIWGLYPLILILLESKIGYSQNVTMDDDSFVFPTSFSENNGVKSPVIESSGANQNTTLLNQDYCGRYGMKPAEGNPLPWMVALGYRKPKGRTWMCNGALITNRHVLTVASCVVNDKQLYLAKVGQAELGVKIDEKIDIPINESTVHPSFQIKNVLNEIAILKLERPVSLTAETHPICLPMEPELKDNLFENENAQIAGYGAIQLAGPLSDRIRIQELTIKDNFTCISSYLSFDIPISDKIVCAGINKNGEDPCNGFLGGPLMISRSERFYLVGMLTYKTNCGEVAFPGIYTRITEHLGWIQENVKN